MSALLECLTFLVKRWRVATNVDGKPTEEATQEILDVIKSEVRHVMEELMSRRLRVDGDAAGKYLATTNQSLDKIDQSTCPYVELYAARLLISSIEFFGAAWEPMTAAMSQSMHQSDFAAFEVTVSILRAWAEYQKNSIGALTLLRILIQDLTEKATKAIRTSLLADDTTPTQGLEALTALLSNFSAVIFRHQGTSQVLVFFC